MKSRNRLRTCSLLELAILGVLFCDFFICLSFHFCLFFILQSENNMKLVVRTWEELGISKLYHCCDKASHKCDFRKEGLILAHVYRILARNPVGRSLKQLFTLHSQSRAHQ